MTGNVFDRVRIVLIYADGKTEYTPATSRWFAEWLMANEIANGFYKGKRVVSAIIITV